MLPTMPGSSRLPWSTRCSTRTPAMRTGSRLRWSGAPRTTLQTDGGVRLPAADALPAHRSHDDVEQLVVVVLTQLPEHHPTQAMFPDVVRFYRQRLRIIVSDEGVRGRLPQIRCLSAIVPT